MPDAGKRPHVVIVGGGFGGLNAAKALGKANVDVTLVDRTNHHLFQPLLYQVATASLSPADIAVPIRGVLSRYRNVKVLMAEVVRVDLAQRKVQLDRGDLTYDYLILAVGARTNYLGNDAWARDAPGLKNLVDAISVRERVLRAFEAAEREQDPVVRRRLLTFVVIGGGATGVEMAGAFSELSSFILKRDFRVAEADATRVVLIEAGQRTLTAFPEPLSQKAEKQLTSLGVEILHNTRVKGIDVHGVSFEDGTTLPAATVLWAAGVRGTPLATTLGVELDRLGRVKVQPDCSLKGYPEAFAIGDMAAQIDKNGVAVPGLSPAAIQQGHFVARTILADQRKRPRGEFAYRDKGTMATIGRSRAIAQVGRLKLSGMLAWLAWMGVHVLFLIGFRNRFIVMFEWMWQYITFKRGARLITGVDREGVEPASVRALARPGAQVSPVETSEIEEAQALGVQPVEVAGRAG
ncbi:NAD(P)/FAD-dependent oxidoreductase [Chondromyces crocatus]|uniref:NADH dehydrogenase n=1 Tax=Chondromyces crocatus TaxID=52 RepID=A0A0K1EC86_CHOCO|nr:NAD(P)/FAD-dependent oxidoreductase [Chondromyces crocatus]AKT38496.1 NADH dehydrogenase [Chondromyces crocatus]